MDKTENMRGNLGTVFKHVKIGSEDEWLEQKMPTGYQRIKKTSASTTS